MSSSFIPSSGTGPADQAVENDGWYPDLSVAEMRGATGLGQIFGAERVAAVIQAAMIEVNAGIAAWRAQQVAESLDQVPADSYGGQSAKLLLYKTGVYARARAMLLDATRDYDSTKSGHQRADALEETVDGWLRQSSEALARLTGRPRTVVELI
ncbi:head completion/stabilization protein [Telmatospirillum sp. J64-1]|uniref:head completion/stabilization protein n=1 Tax=Telmatospirillum sp. J64-1 TaxID=2502183 RepID=UPI00115E0CC4|nr:head completion/stabilization protein [Telmatospirillum sp. J64-1]